MTALPPIFSPYTLAADFDWLVGGQVNQRPQFFAFQSGQQSIPNNSAGTNAGYQNVVRDTDSGWNGPAGVYTIATPGLWLWTATMAWATGGAGARGLQLIVGGNVAWNFTTNAIDGNGHTSAFWMGTVGLGAACGVTPYQVSGGALNTLGNGHVSIAGIWLGQ